MVENNKPPLVGLDKDYAFQWSYGIAESMTFLVPNYYGGSSQESLSDNSAVAKAMQQQEVPNWQSYLKQMPTYWGSQPFTSGPVYFGSVIIFLFVLGLMVVRDRIKWWLLTATLLTLFLSWGKNFSVLSDFFFDYFPLYNKFRAVSSILVIAGLCIPILALLAVKEFSEHVDDKNQYNRLLKSLKIAVYIVGGTLLLMLLLPGFWGTFVGDGDAQMPEWLQTALKSDRETMFRKDAARSLILIMVVAALLWSILKHKIKSSVGFVLFAALLLIDLWQIDKRYLNEEKFVSKSQIEQTFQMRDVDRNILQDTDPNYRVLDMTIPTFNSASSSYYHKTIGGYHAAKLRRYQELIEKQFSKGVNQDVLDMLNTKYIIFNPDSTQQAPPIAQLNPGACGNAWFVQKVFYAKNANDEMQAINSFNPHNEAIVDEHFKQFINPKKLGVSSNGYIKLIHYKPDHLTYEYSSDQERLTVFSEIYYEKGWKMYVDGKEKSYFRANYVLRAAQIPSGNHQIDFKFEPVSYHIGDNISMCASLLLVAGLGFSVYSERKKRI